MSERIFLIMTPPLWESQRGQVEYRAPSLEAEGFIHASASLEQVLWVANRRYAQEPKLLVLCVERAKVKAPIKDELTPRGEGPFPHIYGALNLDAVAEAQPLAHSEGRWVGWA